MGNSFSYRIGIDVGIASTGWAVIQVNSEDEPIHIIDMGARVFPKAEVPKTGESLTKKRREARCSRRRLSRRKHRVIRVKYLLEKEAVIDVEKFEEKYHKPGLPNVYELRVRALDEKISEEDMAQILLFIVKHRGFKSTRKAGNNKDEDGKVLAAVKENKKIFESGGYRTVGEMIYKDELFHTDCPWDCSIKLLTPRNTSGNYSRTILREDLVDEVKMIFEAQRQYGNKCAAKEIEDEYLNILTSQRSFDEGPGPMAGKIRNPYAMDGFGSRIGLCTLELTEKRAPKAAYSSELFVALERINHLRIESKYGDKRFLTEEERQIIFDLMYKRSEVSYTQVRRALNLSEEDNFVGITCKQLRKKDLTDEEQRKKAENAKFISLKYYYIFSKILGANQQNCSNDDLFEMFDIIATILTDYKSDISRTEKLKKLNIDNEKIDELLSLDPAGHINLSCKATRKLIPHLMLGVTYDKACSLAGYDFKGENKKEKLAILKGSAITEEIQNITNPVVRRAISQSIKVINAIIFKYGTPQAINVELAREMSKTFDERNEIQREQEKNEARNKRIKQLIQKEFNIANPKGQDIIKYRLWEEQNGICLYSGNKIPADELFSGAYEIDHILPYSRTYNDSYANKVLVEASENREKGNRIPFEYFGNDVSRWDEFESRVYMIYRNSAKAKRLIKKQLSDEEMADFKSRNLNDTRYIARLLYNLLDNYLEFEPFNKPEKKRHVMAVNGSITAYLRKRWGFGTKDRSVDTHHAKDAVVIACVTNGIIQKISKYIKGREIRFSRNLTIIDEKTGEIYKPCDYSRNEWDKMFGAEIPLPWPYFKTELDIRMGLDPYQFLMKHSDVAHKIGYTEQIMKFVRPIFVSRMANHKVTGAGHKETVGSAKYFQSRGISVSKVDLSELKLKTDKETGMAYIEGYFQPESDTLLYNALIERLQAFDGDAKKAFVEPFYKPKADGSRGPIVRKVKIENKMTSGVYVMDGNGIASNGEMVRIDVFCENKKYYFVPIYTSDVVKKNLPNKACVANKAMNKWKEMDNDKFKFSLYPGDLICVNKKRGIKAKNNNGDTVLLEEDQFVYYQGADISTASISGKTHESSISFRGLGIQSLLTFTKCQVDVLGCISCVGKEKRKSFGEV